MYRQNYKSNWHVRKNKVNFIDILLKTLFRRGGGGGGLTKYCNSSLNLPNNQFKGDFIQGFPS